MTQRLFLIGRAWLQMAALFATTMLATSVLAADTAGSVSFVIGEASVIEIDGTSRPVVRGDKINAGQTLVTGSSGHIHMTMVDKAFISVRPKSRLKIQDYHYDAAAPANNRIKFELEQGVARSITGRAGEASRDNYRLNTPLAAIGIRGTDFVVHASPEVTRVYVQTGAVVVSPLSEACLASALGPCMSASTRVLTAAMSNAYLELRSRTDVPLLVPIEKGLESPNTVAPPRPEEPRPAMNDKQTKVSSNYETNSLIRDTAADSLKTKVDIAAVPLASSAPAVSRPAAVEVSVPPPEPKLWWGRWSTFLAAGEEANGVATARGNIPGEREIGGGNDVFGLYREIGSVVMPGSGTAKFELAKAEAYYMTPGLLVSPASVTSPSLMIDFGAGRYDTSLSLNAGGMPPVTVQSRGTVTFQGRLLNDSWSTTSLNGWLSVDSTQAAYVFDQPVSGNISVVGATRWTR